MADPNAGLSPSKQSGTATRAVAVTKSDATVLDPVPRALYVGTAGDVAVVTIGGDDVVFKNVASGSVLLIRVSKVKAATTASDILALA